MLSFVVFVQPFVYVVAGHKEESPMQESQGSLMLSPELSPSNSSGGTYMWDEEGLEPLGGPVAHRLDSYDDSELNSIVSPHFTFN